MQVIIEFDSIVLEGILFLPNEPKGIVLFVHGSGSSRLSPRNTFVAKILNEAGFATLLIDLLTKKEDQNYETRFDIDLLTKRVGKIIDWINNSKELKHLPLGLFGASTGAAAALKIAALKNKQIQAIVSRGGRPDLAMKSLNKVTAPILLIVGGNDFEVIELNQLAFKALTTIKKLEIIPHATHLFEERGCLEKVAHLAKEWFLTYLRTERSRF